MRGGWGRDAVNCQISFTRLIVIFRQQQRLDLPWFALFDALLMQLLLGAIKHNLTEPAPCPSL